MWQSKPPAGIQLNKNHPLAQGLVGCWLFNEGSGLRANDLSGNYNTGILTNFEPMTSISGWNGEIIGTTLSFDGINDFVDCGNSPSLTITKDLTLSAFVKISSSTASIQGIIGTREGKNDNTQLYEIVTNTSGTRFLFRLGNGVSIITTSSTQSVISFGIYYHVVGVVSDVNMFLYRNGVLVDTGTFSGTRQSALQKLTIGASQTVLRFLNGTISLPCIWNRALSPQEIQQLYSNPYAIFLNSSERIRKIYYDIK